MQSGGLGDTVKKTLSFFGVDKIAEAARIWAGLPAKSLDGSCDKCMGRAILLNELFSYKVTRTIRLLKDYKHPLTNGNSWEAKAGEIIVIDKKHPIYNLLLFLADKKIVEEI